MADLDLGQRFERVRELVLIKNTLDMTIYSLQECYLRTLGLLNVSGRNKSNAADISTEYMHV